ncbi:hypothetical protein GCM10027288_03110 [Bordetella tumbae]
MGKLQSQRINVCRQFTHSTAKHNVRIQRNAPSPSMGRPAPRNFRPKDPHGSARHNVILYLF